MKNTCTKTLCTVAGNLLLAVSLFNPISMAMGGSLVAPLIVSATVVPYCIVGATRLFFEDSPSSIIDQTAAITAACTTGISYYISVNVGSETSASTPVREMTEVRERDISYAILNNSSRTAVGDKTVGADTLQSTGTGFLQNFTVQSLIPEGQVVATGAYHDIVTVTVTY